LTKSGKVEGTIQQLRFCDSEGHNWVLPPKRYRALRLIEALMAASIDFLSQPSNMSSVQLSLLHSLKLEYSNDLGELSSDSSKGELLNVSLPSGTTNTPISNSNCNKLSKSVLTHIGSPIQSSFSRPCSTPILKSVPMSWNALDA
jgi:hypothetical protein